MYVVSISTNWGGSALKIFLPVKGCFQLHCSNCTYGIVHNRTMYRHLGLFICSIMYQHSEPFCFVAIHTHRICDLDPPSIVFPSAAQRGCIVSTSSYLWYAAG